MSQRINERMRELGLSGVDVMKATGVSSGAVSQWRTGATKPSGDNLVALSKELDCQPAWLTTGITDRVRENIGDYRLGPPIGDPIPLVSSVQAGDWAEIVEDFPPEDADKWIRTTAKVGPRAFALIVKGDSMQNPHGPLSISEGSIVIVDPDAVHENGKIVVARLEDLTEATIKKLVIDGPNRYLMPLNPNYKPIEINGHCTIIGVVRQVVQEI